MNKEESKERYICVGQVALRNPDGSFQPAEPIYRRYEDGEDVESKLCDEIAQTLAHQYKLYLEQQGIT